jgi:hypothetical protein
VLTDDDRETRRQGEELEKKGTVFSESRRPPTSIEIRNF